MKKLFLLFILFAFTLTYSSGQGINFESNKDLNAALEKAKKENKLVFIDAYAEWCGPCKMMARDIFPQQHVGDYYNTHFVNLKLDMEKEENLFMVEKYDVAAFPTYLFLNADGELVHKGLGRKTADKFIELAKAANDNENSLMGLFQKIQNGDYSSATINKYLALNPRDKGNEIIIDTYFQTLLEREIYTKENWDMFDKYVENFNLTSFKFVLENRNKISDLVGKEKVDDKIARSISTAFYVNPQNTEHLRSVDPAIYDRTIAKVRFASAFYKQRQNLDDTTAWFNFIQSLPSYFEHHQEPSIMSNVARIILQSYQKFNDFNSLKTALNLAKRAYKLSPTNTDFTAANTYARLLYENGKRKEAIKIGTVALELATQANHEEAIKNYKADIEKFKRRRK